MRELCTFFLSAWLGCQVCAAEPETVLVPQEPPSAPLLGEPSGYAAPCPLETPFLQVQAGYRTWLSFGQSTISVSGTGGYPDILSELHWKKMFNPIQELSLEGIWWDRLITRVEIGGGTVGNGQLRDQDYEYSGRMGLTSDTEHSVNSNDLLFFSLDLGYRFVDLQDTQSRFTLDFLVGYQSWEEKYYARGGTMLYPELWAFPAGDVLSNHFQWDSFRVGCRSELQLLRWAFAGKLLLVPVSHFHNSDIHYLRTDLLQDPSFCDQATGGYGVMGDLTVTYRVWRGLSLEAGYRLWDLESGSGLSVARTTEGDFVMPLHRAHTLRQGVLLGLQYRF